jgi:WD40 repeat protein
MALSPDGTRVAAVFEKQVKVFDVETGREIHGQAIRGARSLAFTPDGSHLLVGEAIQNAVHDWNLATGEVRRQELPHTPGMASAEGIRQITVSPDGKQLAISLMDYSLTLWTQNAHNTDLGYLADQLKNGGGANQVAQLADYVLVGGVRVPRKQ